MSSMYEILEKEPNRVALLEKVAYVARSVSMCATTVQDGIPLRIVPDNMWEQLHEALAAYDNLAYARKK